MELTPEFVDIFLLVGHGDEFHQVEAYGRVSAVSADHEGEGDFDFGAAGEGVGFGVAFEPGEFVFEVDAGEFVVEEELDVGHGFEMVQEGLV